MPFLSLNGRAVFLQASVRVHDLVTVLSTDNGEDARNSVSGNGTGLISYSPPNFQDWRLAANIPTLGEISPVAEAGTQEGCEVMQAFAWQCWKICAVKGLSACVLGAETVVEVAA